MEPFAQLKKWLWIPSLMFGVPTLALVAFYRTVFAFFALLCFVDVSLPNATAQQGDKPSALFLETKANAEKGDTLVKPLLLVGLTLAIVVCYLFQKMTADFVAPIPPLEDPKKRERTEQESKEQDRKERERREQESKEQEHRSRTAVFDCVKCGTGIRIRLQEAATYRCPTCKAEYKTKQAGGDSSAFLILPTSIEKERSAEKKSQPKRAIPPDIRSALSVFGLGEEANFEEVRSAYRDCIKQHHPDKVAHLGAKLQKLAEMETKQFNAAYEKLETFYAAFK